MITPELIAFIRAQLALGRSRDQIRLELMQGGGWKQSDVDDVFASIGLTTPPSSVQVPGVPGVAPTRKRSGGMILWLAFILILLGGVFAFAQHYNIQSLDDVKKVIGITTESSDPITSCAPGYMYDVTNDVCVISPTQGIDPMTMPLGTTENATMPDTTSMVPVETSLVAPATVVSIAPEFASFRVKAGGLYKNNVYVPAPVYITATYSDGTTAVISDMTLATYSIADPAFAKVEEITITKNGMDEKVVDLKGVKAGKTTLLVTYQGLSKSIPVQVLAGSTTSTRTTTAPRPAASTTTTTSPQTTVQPSASTSADKSCPNLYYYDSVADTCYPY